VMNCGGFCLFSTFTAPAGIINELIEAITGMDFNSEVSVSTGLRILNLRQAFNVREGIKPADMSISQRAIGNPPLKEGPLKDVTVDSRLLAKNFFETADWEFESGKPSLKILQSLGHLDEVIKDLHGV